MKVALKPFAANLKRRVRILMRSWRISRPMSRRLLKTLMKAAIEKESERPRVTNCLMKSYKLLMSWSQSSFGWLETRVDRRDSASLRKSCNAVSF